MASYNILINIRELAKEWKLWTLEAAQELESFAQTLQKEIVLNP